MDNFMPRVQIKKYFSEGKLVGSISTSLTCLVYPPREETAGRMSGKPCLWRKLLIKILRLFWRSEMSSDDSHWRSHMTPTACSICTCAVFTTFSFNFGLPPYFVSHCCYGRRVFQKKAEQSCLTVVWQMTCQRSHILVCIMSTPCFCFVRFSLLWII